MLCCFRFRQGALISPFFSAACSCPQRRLLLPSAPPALALASPPSSSPSSSLVTPPVVVIPAAIVRTPAAIGELLPSSTRRRLPLVLVADLLADSRWCHLLAVLVRTDRTPAAIFLPSSSPLVADLPCLASPDSRRRSSRRFSLVPSSRRPRPHGPHPCCHLLAVFLSTRRRSPLPRLPRFVSPASPPPNPDSSPLPSPC
ncbi:hypothetical protein ACLOJK_008711 [Asimina triloba]